MWVRAVWMEGDKEEKGVLHCSWLKDKYVKMPKRQYETTLCLPPAGKCLT